MYDLNIMVVNYIKYFIIPITIISLISCNNSIHDYEITKETKLIKLLTNKGEITVELYEEKAPETVANFLKYVKDKKFNGTIFHRVIPNFMIQGGGHLPDMSEVPSYEPIVNESSNNLSNKKGTIAMARTSIPNSATSQFFINLRDNDFLAKENSQDGQGYCVFGNVIEGMEVVEQIGILPTGNNAGHSDVPIESVVIESVEIIN